MVNMSIEKIQLDRVCEELESSDEVEVSDYLGHGITTFYQTMECNNSCDDKTR